MGVVWGRWRMVCQLLGLVLARVGVSTGGMCALRRTMRLARLAASLPHAIGGGIAIWPRLRALRCRRRIIAFGLPAAACLTCLRIIAGKHLAPALAFAPFPACFRLHRCVGLQEMRAGQFGRGIPVGIRLFPRCP